MLPRFLPLLPLVFAIVLPALPSVMAREFTDRDGRKMEAELVSHAGADSPLIKIRRDGREFTVEIARFSPEDQEFIREWMKSTPPADAVGIKATRKNVGGGKFLYELELQNLGDAPLGKMHAEYIVYMENSAGNVVSDRGKTAPCTPLAARAKAQVETAALDPNTIISKEGGNSSSITVNSSNDRRKRRSDLLGILVRLRNEKGEMVTEWRSPGAGFPEKWPDAPADDQKVPPSAPKTE